MFKTFSCLSKYQTTILKSQFYCFGLPVSNETQAKQIVKQYKTTYKDASHLCYAYILGNDQETYYYSDGGEPSKTAGLPIYLALKANYLSCCLVIIVRYFGGIKFGVKKLKDSFSHLANQTIKLAKLTNGCLVNLYKVKVKLSEFKSFNHQFANYIVKRSFLTNEVEVYLGLLPNQKEMVSKYQPIKIQSDYLLLKNHK